MSQQAARFPVAMIALVAQHLADMPAPEPTQVSTRELVRRVAPGLLAMRAKGYSVSGIVEFLRQQGVLASRFTLKKYVVQELAQMRSKPCPSRRGPSRPRFPWPSPSAGLGPAPADSAGAVEVAHEVDAPSNAWTTR